jgi:sulfur-oxidizing protein SoxX
MTRSKTTLITAVAVIAAGVAVGCASLPGPDDLDAQAKAMHKADFRSQGIAKSERINQDLSLEACSSGKPPSAELAKKIEAANLATLKWPAGGQYFGDFAAGEKLAQNGRGMTWSDKSADTAANGGNCYNCHQIDKKEISFGTIGPSLWNYGKLRGVKDLNDPAAAAIIQYTWGKIWNSQAYTACSNMPRAGHNGVLSEGQIRHLMSLLLDPKSPVNQ